MDSKRFDRLTMALAEGKSRRSVIKGLLGFGGAAAVSTVAFDESDARRSRGTLPPTPPSTTAPPCPAGTESCDSNSTGCCAICDEGVTCGYDCCATSAQCCDGECCYPTDTCLAKAFPNSNQPEETCCPTSQTCENQCCDGECFDPNPLSPLASTYLGTCCPSGLAVCLNKDGTQTCIDPESQCCLDVDCTDLPDECAEPVCGPQNQCRYLVCEGDLTCCPETSTCVLLGTDDNCAACGNACEACENCTNGECVDYCSSGNCCSDGSCLAYDECCFDEDCADAFSCTENVCADGLCSQTNNPLNCTGLPDDICWICEPTTAGADADGCVFNCNVDTSACCPGCLICGSNGQCVPSDDQCGSCESCVGTDCEPILDDFECRDEPGMCCGGTCTVLGTTQNCSKCGDVCDEFPGSYCKGNACGCLTSECAPGSCGPVANACGDFNQCGDCEQGFVCENGTCVADLSCQTDTDCNYLDDISTCKSGVCSSNLCQQVENCLSCEFCVASNGTCSNNCINQNPCNYCDPQDGGTCLPVDDGTVDCSPTETCCGGQCTNITFGDNCGGCGIKCGDCGFCDGGVCQPLDNSACPVCQTCEPDGANGYACAKNDKRYGEFCSSDQTSCLICTLQGECGGYQYNEAPCRVSNSSICCSGICIEPGSNELYCGDCNTQCLSGETCCDGICADVLTDNGYCGDCSTRCSTANCQLCENGTCVDQCTGGYVCNGSGGCVCPSNCGQCGICRDAVCQPDETYDCGRCRICSFFSEELGYRCMDDLDQYCGIVCCNEGDYCLSENHCCPIAAPVPENQCGRYADCPCTTEDGESGTCFQLDCVVSDDN